MTIVHFTRNIIVDTGRSISTKFHPCENIQRDSAMLRNQSTAENARSMPCIGMPSKLVSSDDSLSSFISFKSASTDDVENDRLTESRVDVRAMIDKFGSPHRKLVENSVSDFSTRNKPFKTTVPEKLKTPNNECKNMEGDVIRLDDDKNIVKNAAFEIFSATTHFEQNLKPLQVDKKPVRIVHFGLKNSTSGSDGTDDNMDKRFWRNIVAMAKVNRVYYQCMTQIMNNQEFPNLKHVKEFVTLALKNGEESEFMESELITYIKEYLGKFSIALNSTLNQELNKIPFLSHHTRLSVLQMELEKMKAKMKIAEDSITLLKKENNDLLNTLNTYSHENIHKVSLEKLLEFEQQKNDKLKKTITLIFEKKMLPYNVNEDNSYKR